jgi:hypothetical protein
MNGIINEEELLSKFVNFKSEEELKKSFEITSLLPVEEQNYIKVSLGINMLSLATLFDYVFNFNLKDISSNVLVKNQIRIS